ncbi:MAG: hypothetical protein IPL26_15000 [Leptospiraceae bacterium]|nr:hypothetical protein [Leptospiraceae bacterium]
MKIISKKIFLLTFALILTVGCIKSKKQDRSGLESLVINNILNGTASDKYNNGSLVILTRADLSNLSFTGQCFDTFTLSGVAVSPSNYYNTIAGGGGGLLNNDYKKYALSTSNCAALSFTGTTNTGFGSSSQRPNSEQDLTFKMYSCDPNNNPCSKTAITAAGF